MPNLQSIRYFLANCCLVLFFAVLSLGQLQRVSQAAAVSLYWHELLMGVFVLMVFQNKQLASLVSAVRNNKLVVFTVSWVVLTLALAQLRQPDLIQLLYMVRVVFYGYFLWVFYHYLQCTKNTLLPFFPLLSLGYTLYFGLLQYVLLPDTRFLRMLGWDDHYFRMIGTQFDPNFLGMILVIFLFAVVTVRHQLQRLLGRYAFVAPALIAAGIGWTFSRSSYLALAAGLVVLVVLQLRATTQFSLQQLLKQTLLPASVLCMVVIAYLIAPKPGGEGVNITRTSTIESRTSSLIRQVSDLSVQTLIAGQGVFSRQEHTAPTVSRGLLTDNIVSLVLQGTGVVGVVLFLLLCYQIFVQLSSIPEQAAAFVALLVHAQFNNSLFQVFVMIYFVTTALSISKVDKMSE